MLNSNNKFKFEVNIINTIIKKYKGINRWIKYQNKYHNCKMV